MTTPLAILEDRLRRLLPDQYQHPDKPVAVGSMSSAALRFGTDGRIAWDQMWGSFCDLAMAGGPPHKGTLLAPPPAAECHADQGHYRQVVEEICRGIKLAAKLEASPAQALGWVRVECADAGMAAWLLRAITMENIAVRSEGSSLYFPAGPGFRIEKEVKNVITVIAKTSHYWRDHMQASRRQDISQLLETMNAGTPCLAPTSGWRSIEMHSVPSAIRAMRLLIADNILARREGTELFVPAGAANESRVNAALANATLELH